LIPGFWDYLSWAPEQSLFNSILSVRYFAHHTGNRT